MSLRSTTGAWVALTPDARLIGPFDGEGPARQFRADCRRHGVRVTLVRLWEPSEARKAIGLYG